MKQMMVLLNAVHSREGCYTYIKEIVGGNSIIVLAEEDRSTRYGQGGKITCKK